MSSRFTSILLSAIIFVMLTACATDTPVPNLPPPTEAHVAAVTIEAETATPTRTPIPFPSVTPTRTPWPTLTPLSTPTLQPTPTITPATQHPLVSASDSENASQAVNLREGLVGHLIFNTKNGGDLYRINVDGSGLTWLADGVIDPVVSPDGQQVAFTRWDGVEIGTLYVINFAGSGERVIMGDTLQAKSPTWSPDSREIVLSFQHGGIRNPEEECREFDFDDGLRIPENVEITSSQITRDGIRICFIRFEDLQWGLRQVNVASGQFEDLAVDTYSFNPAWDPVQPWRVIYDGDKGLMQLDVTNDNLWPITTDLRDTGPVFSLDGQHLALTYRQHDHWEVYTLDLQNGVRQRLTKPSFLAIPQYSSAAPTWSPDGHHLAFLTDRSGPWEIWVMAADGSDPHPLFPPEFQAQFGLDYQGVNERMLSWIE